MDKANFLALAQNKYFYLVNTFTPLKFFDCKFKIVFIAETFTIIIIKS